jgi:hypothetical protein
LFLEELEDILLVTDLNQPFILVILIGDLNLDLLSGNTTLSQFLKSYTLKNFVFGPTREVTKFFQKTKNLKTKNSLVDLILTN